MNRHHSKILLVACAGLLTLSCATQAKAVVVYGAGDSSSGQNLQDPTADGFSVDGLSADTAFSSVGSWGDGAGVAIAPNWFITMQHVSGTPNTSYPFILDGTTYYSTGTYAIIPTGNGASNDNLVLFQVNGTIPSADISMLYNSTDYSTAAFSNMLIVGNGGTKGGVITSSTTNGWNWTSATGQPSWGLNAMSGTYTDSYNRPLITFGYIGRTPTGQSNQNNNAMITAGDSGGGVFVDVGGTWELAAINDEVGPQFSTTNNTSGEINAAIYNGTGLYYEYSSTPTPEFKSASNYESIGYSVETGGESSQITSAIIANETPEPGSLAILAVGSLGLLVRHRRRAS